MLSKAKEPQSYGKSTLVSKETSFPNNIKDSLNQVFSNWPVDILQKLSYRYLVTLIYLAITQKENPVRKIYRYSSFFPPNTWMQCNNFLQPVIYQVTLAFFIFINIDHLQ